MKNVHPSNGLSVADLAQINLSGLQVLMPQYDLGDDLQRDTVPGLKGDGVAEAVKMFRPEIHTGEIRAPAYPLPRRSLSMRFD
jgi:hypothetical protein